jgi:hypothetical protein
VPGANSPKTISIPILPELRAVIDKSPTGELTYLMTHQDKPYSVKGMAKRVKDRCVEAGLPHCSAHGVRKAGVAENGASEATLMAIFGWDDAKQVVNYTRAARRKKVEKAGMHLIVPQTEPEQNS